MPDTALQLLTQINRSRCAAAGLDVFHYDLATADLASFEGWRQRFAAIGRDRRERAIIASAQGRGATATQLFEAAALWLHFATCVPGEARDEVAALLKEADLTHRRTLGESATFITADETAGLFCGILERPEGLDSSAPVVIVVPGLDSSKAEFARLAAEFRLRGCATLRIDGPGQGERLADAGPMPEYEAVATAAVDALAGRPGFDLTRIGAVGLSLGGYYVPRALAFEPRIRAAVAVTGLYAFDPWESLPPVVRQVITLRCGGRDEARAFAASVDLAPLARRIEQPLLLVTGEIDPLVPPSHGRRLAAEARRVELLELDGGDHLGANRRWLWQTQAVDWLVSRLRA